MAERINVGLNDELRDEIENLYSDLPWKELSLAKKVNVLIRKGLEKIKEEQSIKAAEEAERIAKAAREMAARLNFAEENAEPMDEASPDDESPGPKKKKR